jgi:predicted nucleic acid-binding protein
MILVDTSVWINHLRQGEPALVKLLASGQLLMHDFVRGELGCGNLKNRQAILSDLAALPTAAIASTDEVLALIDRHKLQGRGLGWIDVHLLASAMLSHARLWTVDKNLSAVAGQLKLS